jgi:hypothetical protein
VSSVLYSTRCALWALMIAYTQVHGDRRSLCGGDDDGGVGAAAARRVGAVRTAHAGARAVCCGVL